MRGNRFLEGHSLSKLNADCSLFGARPCCIAVRLERVVGPYGSGFLAEEVTPVRQCGFRLTVLRRKPT